MVALKYSDIVYEDNCASYAEINAYAKIDSTVLIEPFCTIEQDVTIGAHTIIGPYNHIRNGTTIGENCKIGGNNVFEGHNVSIGNNVRIGTHNNFTWDTTIEDFVFLAGHFTGANDLKMVWNRKIEQNELHGYTIKFGARIGLGVIMMPGRTVGKEALVGAASLVTKDIPEGEMWYGVPAKKCGKVPTEERIVLSKW